MSIIGELIHVGTDHAKQRFGDPILISRSLAFMNFADRKAAMRTQRWWFCFVCDNPQGKKSKAPCSGTTKTKTKAAPQ